MATFNYIFIQNTSSEYQEIHIETTLGYVMVCQICSSTSEINDNCMQITNIKTTSNDSQSKSGTKLSIPERQKLLTMFLHFDNDNLTDSQAQPLTNHIMSCHDVFALQDHERGKIDKVTHIINSDDNPPIYKSSCQIPFYQCTKMLKFINDMLYIARCY